MSACFYCFAYLWINFVLFSLQIWLSSLVWWVLMYCRSFPCKTCSFDEREVVPMMIHWKMFLPTLCYRRFLWLIFHNVQSFGVMVDHVMSVRWILEDSELGKIVAHGQMSLSFALAWWQNFKGRLCAMSWRCVLQKFWLIVITFQQIEIRHAAIVTCNSNVWELCGCLHFLDVDVYLPC